MEIFGQEAVELTNYFMRRFKIHKLRLDILGELDVYDVAAFILIDEEMERCRTYRMAQAKTKGGNSSGSRIGEH